MVTKIRRCHIAASLVAVIVLMLVTSGSANAATGALVPAFPSALAGSSASLGRSHESVFGSFGGESPQALIVDQSTGDVYVLDTQANRLLRFSAGGAPVDFAAGPGAGTNAIPGIGVQGFPAFDQVAVDGSSGPAKGDIYVTNSGARKVRVFAPNGEELGVLKGEKAPGGSLGEDCGVAVDQSNGDLYIADWNNRVWQYSPSGSTVSETDYSGGIETTINPCSLAVANGHVYAKAWNESPVVGFGPVEEYQASAFVSEPSSPATAAQVAASAIAVSTDPANGDLYVDEGNKITVLDQSDTILYSFGTGEIGTNSTGVAVAAGADAYVSDSTNHQIHIYGPTLEAGSRANLGSFGSFGGESPQALIVDQASGDVYVLDTQGNQLLRFSAGGAPVDFTAGPGAGTNVIPSVGVQGFPAFDQVAVDGSGGPAKGDIYVTNSGSRQVKVFASSGEPLGTLTGAKTPAGSLGEDCGVAVDQSNGDLYVANWNNRVWRYSPSSSTVSEANYSGGIATSINPCSLAVAKGHVYAKAWNESPVVGFGPVEEYQTSAFVSEPSSPAPATQVATSAIAVSTDPANNDIYVDEGNRITVLDPSGVVLYSFGSGEIGTSSTGIAVAAGADAYVSDSTNHQIHIYGPFSAPPALVETQPASEVKHVTATLNAHIDPNHSLPITACTFEWGTDTSYGETPIACRQGESFTAPASVSAQLTGLTPGTTYHYRIHVSTAADSYDGEDQSFETTPASSTPEVSVGKGTILSSTSTRLEGAVDPNSNSLTDCHFEYVTDTAYQTTGFTDLSSGGSLPCNPAYGTIASDFEDHRVTADATGLDPSTIYRYRLVAENTNGAGDSSVALVPGPPIAETMGSPTRSTTTARLDSRVTPHGAATTYHYQYTTDADYEANGYNNATDTPTAPVQTSDVQDLFFVYVGPNYGGQFRLAFDGKATSDLPYNATAAQVQTALRALPNVGNPNVIVTGGPNGGDANNFSPSFKGSITSFHYTVTFVGALSGVDVPQITVSNGTIPLLGYESIQSYVATLAKGAPAGTASLVSSQLSGLQPATTYHYRVVAENGTPDIPIAGEDRTLTTRASEAPLINGGFPGPPGSDRAWEQVNAPDTGTNPVKALAIADSGERVVYGIYGGSPGSSFGGQVVNNSNDQFAERTASGWQSRDLYPTRAQTSGNEWQGPWGSTELNELYALDYDETNSGTVNVFRMTPGVPAQQLFGASPETFRPSLDTFFTASDGGSRMIAVLSGTNDPTYPVAQNKENVSAEELYDLSSGSPQLIGLLPGNTLPSCGVQVEFMTRGKEVYSGEHWITPDGSHVFFNTYPGSSCSGQPSLYDRDLANATTTLIAPSASFIRYTAGSVFFDTSENLVPGDPPGDDIYRYQIDDHSLHCVTCAIPGGGAVVKDEFPNDFGTVAVSDDGSRIYFQSSRRLLPGSEAFTEFLGGKGPETIDVTGIYRIDVASGDLAYVAPGGGETHSSAEPAYGSSINKDGSVYVFWSASPLLNAVNGQQNGGTGQYYRYDDRDRSLVCASCPGDGSYPRAPVPMTFEGVDYTGVNDSPLDEKGDFVFATPTSLVPADQNTAPPGQFSGDGEDIYEWRDGRLLLVTDGETESKNAFPRFAGMSSDGRNVFFTQAAALTPDAIDTTTHLYDARIGGGFKFPSPPPPCSLEACQGNPSAPPDDPTPGSLSFSGPGNPSRIVIAGKQAKKVKVVRAKHKKTCKRVKHKKKCVTSRKSDTRRANSHRGGSK